ASALAPGNGDVEEMLAQLAQGRNKMGDAIAHLQKAADADPRNARRLYTLGEWLLRAGEPDAAAEQVRLLRRIGDMQPTNLFLLTRRAPAAARTKDAALVRATVARLRKLSPTWAPQPQAQLAKAEKLLAGPLGSDALLELGRLHNVLQAEPGFRRGAEAVAPKNHQVGVPLYTFLQLTPPRTTPAEPDRELTFSPSPLPLTGAKPARWDVALPVWLTGAGKPVVFVASAAEVRPADSAKAVLPFPSGAKKVAPSPAGVLALDWD